MCLHVVIPASCFRLHFAVWFEMHQRMTCNNWIFLRMDTAVPKFESNTGLLTGTCSTAYTQSFWIIHRFFGVFPAEHNCAIFQSGFSAPVLGSYPFGNCGNFGKCV